MSVAIPDVPRIMRANGWTVGAALMDRWLGRPARTAPPFTDRDDGTVTMAWVLSFRRAQSVFDAMLREKVWSNPAGRREVRAMLRRNGLLSNGACFDVFQSTQQMIHRNAVNFRSVDQGLFTGMDDMTAALANFNFHVQIGGSVEPADFDSFRVTVTKVGIYVRDQYDFTGDQELGFWSGNSNFVSVLPFPGSTRLTNASYREWRQTSGRGGDFEVFSDVRVVLLPQPDVFTI